MSQRFLGLCLASGILAACGPNETSELAIIQGDAPQMNAEEQGIANTLAKSTVLIMKRSGDRWRQWCGGVLIGPNVVLSAAHCFADRPSAQDIRVLFEGQFLPQNVDHQAQVTSFALHPEFQAGAMGGFFSFVPVHDAAVLRFEGAAPNGYAPVDIVSEGLPVDNGRQLVISGYGRTRPAPAPLSESQGNLQFAFTELSAFLPWQQEFKNRNSYPTICTGDSGSPAFINEGGRWLILGIVSRGDARCRSEGLFTDIRSQSAWIHSQF